MSHKSRKARPKSGKSSKRRLVVLALVVTTIAVVSAVGLGMMTVAPPQPQNEDFVEAPSLADLAPDWAAINAWPPEEGTGNANPDPDRQTIVIVLDDSGSMKPMMNEAKQAVIEAVSQLPQDAMLAVIALNRGVVLNPLPVSEAVGIIPRALDPVQADGTTPLGTSLRSALRMLEAQAVEQRGFGSYRVLVATDGKASDSAVLRDVISDILSRSPVEVATIGIGIGEGHALNIPGFTQYVSVDSVANLASALRTAAAEQTVFTPVTEFEEIQ